jgi:adenosylhomocysteine nucleosidase
VHILVTFALDSEFAPWRNMRPFRPGKWGLADAHWAEIGGAQVGVVLTGIGPRQAARKVSEIVWESNETVRVCISTGLGGALRPEYRLADVLAARTVSSSGAQGSRESRVIECDPSLVALAGEHGARIAGRVHTAGRVISTAGEKQKLGAEADAVEMESFEVVKESMEYGVRSVVIRAISDTVEEDLPLDMDRILTDDGRVSRSRVLGQLARRPWALPGLLRLGARSKRAAEALASFLDSYVTALARQTNQMSTRSSHSEQPWNASLGREVEKRPA